MKPYLNINRVSILKNAAQIAEKVEVEHKIDVVSLHKDTLECTKEILKPLDYKFGAIKRVHSSYLMEVRF